MIRLLHHPCSKILQSILVISSFPAILCAQPDRGFSNAWSTAQYTRDRTVDLVHTRLEIAVDPAARTVNGTALITLTPINDGLETVILDAEDMVVSSVALFPYISVERSTRTGGRALDYELSNGHLTITLDHAYSRTDTLVLAVAYRAEPQMGLYFIAPDEGYPDKPVQVWSQGEQEENHHWFPTWDFPNDQMTSEMVVTVPAGMTAISNGAFISRNSNSDNTVTWHWHAATPHVTYLVSLIVGEFALVQDRWEDVPVFYYVEPQHRALVERSFGLTPAMLGFYSRVTGVRYPYAKYAQTTIRDFMWGGMENVSATTLTYTTLHDERAHSDYQSDNLVAHELAHQWYGDLLTTKNWNHLWLNEGFATYFEALWTEEHKGAGEFHLEMAENRTDYLKEDKDDYRRPIVTGFFESPSQMFDRHTYQKGSWVLHMIRYLLGDDQWSAAVSYYTNTYAGTVVETNDFKDAIEESTGRSLDWFFDQWVYGGGHPEYAVKWRWNSRGGVIDLTVKQVQPVDDLTALFRMPVEILVTRQDGQDRHVIQVDQAEEVFHLPVTGKPARVEFDPDDHILKKLQFDKPERELLAQLSDGNFVTRTRAAVWLGEKSTGKKVAAALGNTLLSDPYIGARQAAAKALGIIRTKAARDHLLAGLDNPDSRIRRAVITALGNFKGDKKVAGALLETFHSDASYYAKAATVAASARLGTEGAFALAVAALDSVSYREVIRDSAFAAFKTLADMRAIGYAMEWSRYGQPEDARRAALSALPALAKIAPDEQETIRLYLEQLTRDPSRRVKWAAMKALGKLGDEASLPVLQSAMDEALLYRQLSTAREAMEKIQDKSP